MIYQNKQNEIYSFTEIDKQNGFIPSDFKQLTDKQLKAYNNKPLFGVWNGNEWIEDEAESEKNRIRQIESKCNESIEAVYPIYKQINITNLLTPYTEQDRETMKAFIDSKRAICHKAITDGTKYEDVDFSNEY